jgi:chromosome partitioning protein
MVISFASNKGGVGKTTCCSNLANALGNKGKRVLVIDQDSQGNTTALLLNGVDPHKTIRDLYAADGPENITPFILPTVYENLYLVANESKTAALEPLLYTDIISSYYLLKTLIDDIRADYDYILIDCPPNLGIFSLQAMIASDAVIVPIIASSKFSITGFTEALQLISDIAESHNKSLRFLRALVNKVDMRTSVSRLMLEHVRMAFPDKLFETTIPINADIETAELRNTTVIRQAPHSSGAKRFRLLADELIGLTGGL